MAMEISAAIAQTAPSPVCTTAAKSASATARTAVRGEGSVFGSELGLDTFPIRGIADGRKNRPDALNKL